MRWLAIAQGLVLGSCSCPCPRTSSLTNNLQLHARAHFRLGRDLALVGARIPRLHIFYLERPVFIWLLEGEKALIRYEHSSAMKQVFF